MEQYDVQHERKRLLHRMLVVAVVIIISLCIGWYPVVAFTNDPNDRYSNFQYRLGPGEGTDDAVVLVNTDKDVRRVQVTVSEALFDVDARRYVPVDTLSDGSGGTIQDWIRFYPLNRPIGSQELEQALGGGYPARIFPLCRILQFGVLSKSDRDQVAVRSVNRSLEPSEISWLSELSGWCRGVHDPILDIKPGETSRLPFIIHIPEDAAPRYVRAVMLEQTHDQLLVAAPISIIMPSVSPALITGSPLSLEYNSSKGTHEAALDIRNDGDMPALVVPKLVVSKSLLGTSQVVLPHSDVWIDGKSASSVVWVIPTSFMGSYSLRPDITFVGDGMTEPKPLSVGSDVSFVAYPSLKLMFLIGCIVFFIFMVMSMRVYWKRRWVREVRRSWVPYSPDATISLSDLALKLDVSLPLLSDVNTIRPSDYVQRSDSILIPLFKAPIQKKQETLKRSKSIRVRKKLTN